MDTLTFLQRVLPAEGQFVSLIVDQGSTRQAFFSTAAELANHCIKSDSNGHNIYHAISTFKARGSRKQDNVHLTKVLALDVDCAPEKPFPDQKAGLVALIAFIKATGMPKPMIISSGRGLHVYWIMDQALNPSQWKPLAEGLKQMCVAQDFSVDNALTANNSLVLRPTGTHNPKNGAEVKLLLDAPDIRVAELGKAMLHFTQNTSRVAMPPLPLDSTHNVTARPAGSSQLLANLGATQAQLPPAPPLKVYEQCMQIKWAVDFQEKVPEPMWYDIIGVASYCVDREETAKKWSMNHPGYSEQETLKKLAQWKAQATGPATCAKIEIDSPQKCKDCPLKGNITSPAMIGLEYQAVEISSDAPDAIAKEVPLPKSYKRAGHAIVQTVDGTDVEVCPFDIYPKSYGYDESLGYETVRFVWERPHIGWVDLVFRQAYLNTGSREFPTAIADQGIVLSGMKKTEGFQRLLRTYMDQLRNIRTVTDIHNSMGWKEGYRDFVVGDNVYKGQSDGSVVKENVSLQSGASRIGGMFEQAGTLEAWRDATIILEQQKLWGHMFALGQGFAAPLWAFGGLKGVTVSIYGDTGTGKTLAQLWQQSIWGDPNQLHFSAKYTMNALFARLGTYRNLPMTIDEATMMPAEDVGDFCFLVTQGRDKARLSRAAEERNTKEWATVVTVSTNTSFMSKMTASGMDTNAQMARLIEVPLYPHPLFSDTSEGGKMIYRHLEENHGVAGEAYAIALIKLGEKEIRRRIIECEKTFSARFGWTFTGEERYWEADVVRFCVGFQIAYENGIVACNYEPCVKWALSHMDRQRTEIVEATIDGWSLLHEYINEAAATILVVMHTHGQPTAVDLTRHMSNEIYGRFDIYRKTHTDPFVSGEISLVTSKLRQWMSRKGYDYKTLVKEMQAAGIDRSTKKRVWMGRDTEKKAGQHQALVLDLCHTEMKGYLDNGGFMPKLKVVV